MAQSSANTVDNGDHYDKNEKQCRLRHQRSQAPVSSTSPATTATAPSNSNLVLLMLYCAMIMACLAVSHSVNLVYRDNVTTTLHDQINTFLATIPTVLGNNGEGQILNGDPFRHRREAAVDEEEDAVAAAEAAATFASASARLRQQPRDEKKKNKSPPKDQTEKKDKKITPPVGDARFYTTPILTGATTTPTRGDQQQQQQQQRLLSDLKDDAYTVEMAKADPTAKTATVMGVASGYSLEVYERFVGSLRKTGYEGHIILGVAPDVSPTILRYFAYRNVTAKILEWVDCTYAKTPAEEADAQARKQRGDIFKETTCAHPYPDIKIRWSRFPLQRDWLTECTSCTGPVLVADVRDTLFQRNPFGYDTEDKIEEVYDVLNEEAGDSTATNVLFPQSSSQQHQHYSKTIQGLQVFQEHPNQTTDHWLTRWPIRECKKQVFHPPPAMLCSGTTVGTRRAMLQYLETMYEEMRQWISQPQCRFDINGDDQSIHNYLFYSGRLPYATSVAYRQGGIVNTIGVEGATMAKRHRALMELLHNASHGDAMWMPFDGADTFAANNTAAEQPLSGRNNHAKKIVGDRWIGAWANLIDDEGYFVEADGVTRSRVVHQWDRFGRPYVDLWLRYQLDLIRDPVPADYDGWDKKQWSQAKKKQSLRGR